MFDAPFAAPVWSHPGHSSWNAPVKGPESVELAIIGGGVQGLSTALHAARAGMSVRVFEAGRVGEGASGLNGGQVIPGLKHNPKWVARHFGDELVAFSASTADKVFDLIRLENLDVPHRRNGWIQAFSTKAAIKGAKARNKQWKALGADVMMLSTDHVEALTGSSIYIGGWLDRRAGTIDPLAFTLELARIASEAGAKVVQNSRVVGLRKQDGTWRLALQSGIEITARSVLVATNAYSDGLVPGLAQTIVPLNSFQIATPPLPDRFDSIMPEERAVSDSRRILVYYRRTRDGRLILGGRGQIGHPKSAGGWAHLERAMAKIFPELAGIGIEKRWFGQVAMTPDHMPRIHEPEKGLIAAIGCNGRGVGLMTALGERLALYARDGDPAALPLAITPIRPLPLHGLRRIGAAAAIAAMTTLDALER
ncbi:MAG: FAD-binding oxidoreductase [Rhizobiaceae bacterium]|nr:FAD-binding oxidoreductase [Rhizobiaceae bacterium]